MSKTNERHNGSFGRHILDQLAEQLAKSKNQAKEEQSGAEKRIRGHVYNLNQHVDSTTLADEFPPIHCFTSEELQLLILVLLADQPAQGFELINNFETLSKGSYIPSPAMVYPALTFLDELGHVTALSNGNRKSYALSNTGKQYLADHSERVNELWLALTTTTLKRVLATSPKPQEDVAKGPAWIPELIQAQGTLKNVLTQCSNASATEQERITEILLQAVRAILNK